MYKNVGLSSFLIAGVIVSIPAAILSETNTSYAWSYVVLILLALLVFYSPQVGQFSGYLRSKF